MITKIKMTECHKYSIFNIQSTIPILLSALITVLLTTAADTSSAQTWHRVRWVNDGDTIVLDDGLRVRYIGINAPEIDHENQRAQPYGYQAKSFNKNRVGSRKVRLEYDTDRRDRYGRELAYIFVEDRTFINARLLEVGLAYYQYGKSNLKYSVIMLKAQQQAMAAKIGMWRSWGEKEKIYIGNRNSRRFHISSCKFARKINAANKVQFLRKWDAFYQGYAPGKKCIAEFWSYETGK